MQQSLEARATGNASLARNYEIRADAIARTLRSPGESTPTTRPNRLVRAQTRYSAAFFDEYRGSHVQTRVHEELCRSMESIAELSHEHPNILHAQTAAPIVYHFAAIAHESTDPDVAFHLTDFCEHLTQATAGIVKVFKTASGALAEGV